MAKIRVDIANCNLLINSCSYKNPELQDGVIESLEFYEELFKILD